ncbi:hypothetical protein Tco_0752127 [Tanacetum coccineum]|uniref:Uncharacterized protein n=1 Tax=Tanacetum coccineum TaxID=301880 RepID=A0ABQ4Z7M2_9ASTR
MGLSLPFRLFIGGESMPFTIEDEHKGNWASKTRDGFSFKVNGKRLKKYYRGDIDKEDDEDLAGNENDEDGARVYNWRSKSIGV